MTFLPDDITARLLEQAEQLKLNGQHMEAIIILEELLAKDPHNVTALEELADNELSMEQYDRAQRAAEQAIALDKQSFDAHYILGFIASHREDWATSIRCLKVANTIDPNNPEILRCLGWSLFSSGEAASGMVTLERALNLEPDNALVLCDLGVVYLRLKEFMKAKALLKRALELDPENMRAQECLEMASRIELSTRNEA